MKHSKKAIAVVSVALAALALTGCSKPASSSGGSTASGSVTVMVIESLTGVAGIDQSAPKAAQAAADAINANGGIDGKQITVLSCDTASDPNKGTQCVRDAISKGVIAVVGSFDPISSGVMLPLLEQAKIPYIAPVAVQPPDYTSTVSFPVTGGAVTSEFGMVPAAVSLGCKTLVIPSDPATDGGRGQQLVAAWNSAGVSATMVPLSITATDVSPVISQVLSTNPDCISFVGPGPQASQVFTGVRNSGSTAKLISAYGTLFPPIVASLGAAADGITVTSDVPFNNDPALKNYTSQMAQYAPDVTAPNQFTLNAWYSIQVLQQALTGQQIDTPAALLDHLSTMSNITLEGLSQPVSFTTPNSSIFPRAFNPYVQTSTITGGTYVPNSSGWQSVEKYLPAS